MLTIPDNKSLLAPSRFLYPDTYCTRTVLVQSQALRKWRPRPPPRHHHAFSPRQCRGPKVPASTSQPHSVRLKCSKSRANPLSKRWCPIVTVLIESISRSRYKYHSFHRFQTIYNNYSTSTLETQTGSLVASRFQKCPSICPSI